LENTLDEPLSAENCPGGKVANATLKRLPHGESSAEFKHRDRLIVSEPASGRPPTFASS